MPIIKQPVKSTLCALYCLANILQDPQLPNRYKAQFPNGTRTFEENEVLLLEMKRLKSDRGYRFQTLLKNQFTTLHEDEFYNVIKYIENDLQNYKKTNKVKSDICYLLPCSYEVNEAEEGTPLHRVYLLVSTERKNQFAILNPKMDNMSWVSVNAFYNSFRLKELSIICELTKSAAVWEIDNFDFLFKKKRVKSPLKKVEDNPEE